MSANDYLEMVPLALIIKQEKITLPNLLAKKTCEYFHYVILYIYLNIQKVKD